MPDNSTTDSYTDTYHSLYRDGLTDGLPVVPPTDERVAEMLRGTDYAPEHVIGQLGNADNPITIEDLAANAVMAGCLPTYMPVLEAGARALADPHSNSIQFSVSTGSWAYQWVVNGPVRNELNVEGGSGAFGPNFHANQTIPRALGMAYRNTAKIYPGEKDMGVMGNPFKFSFLAGENEEASPWEPYHVTQGFEEEESTITVAGPNSWVQWYPDRNEAEHVLRGMLENTPKSMQASSGEDMNATITHFVNPYNSEELGKADLTKQEIKEYMVENSYQKTSGFEEAILAEAGPEEKVAPRQIQQYDDVDAINVVSMGGPGRFSAIAGTSVGGPVTKKIEFPSNWDALVEEYSLGRDWVPSAGFYD